jgi:hypothetical protein
VSRLLGGVLILLTVAVAAALVSHVSHRTIKALPGLPMVNHLGGAALGATWGLFLMTVVLTLVAVVPVPPSLAGELDDSTVASALTDPEGIPQLVLGELSGDRVVRTLLELRRRFGEDEVLAEADERVTMPAAAPGVVTEDAGSAGAVFDLVNVARVGEGRDPLAWSPLLAGVALEHAMDMYLEGYIGHQSPAGAGVAERAGAAGAVYRLIGENIALGATADDLHEGLMGSANHRAEVLGAGYRRLGVAVVSGPLGLLTVEVFSG